MSNSGNIKITTKTSDHFCDSSLCNNGIVCQSIKGRENESTEVTSVDELTRLWEPKRNFRWVLRIDGIDAFLLKSFKFPNLIRHYNGLIDWEIPYFTIDLIDSCSISALDQINDWINESDFIKRTGTLDLLDSFAVSVEKWDLKGLWIKKVEFSKLNYDDQDARTIRCEIYFDQMNLTASKIEIEKRMTNRYPQYDDMLLI